MVSTLTFVPADSATVPIDWSRVPKASKQSIKSWTQRRGRTLPATIGELANAFNGGKFFGYMRPELCTLLADIGEFGLSPSTAPVPDQPSQLGPRFYMRYNEDIWILIFVPGKRDGVTGRSLKKQQIREEDFENDHEYNRAKAAGELEIAENFDARLKQCALSSETSEELVLGVSLAGGLATTFKRNLEGAQMASAMLTLPVDHPMLNAYMASMFESLRR